VSDLPGLNAADWTLHQRHLQAASSASSFHLMNFIVMALVAAFSADQRLA